MRRGPLRNHVRGQLALEHRPRKRRGAAGLLHADHVGDQRAVEARRQGRREIARLIAVREKHHGRRGLRDHLLERLHEGIGRVMRQRRMIDRDHLRHRGLGELARHAGHILSGHCDLHRHRSARQLLRRRNGLPARAIELAVFLFRDHENHRTLASSRSRLTSSFAASAGEPPIITVCLDFCGAYNATIFCRATSGGRAGHLGDLFLLRRHDAFERGIAQRVDAALDGQQRRQRHRQVLEPAAFELALDAQGAAVNVHFHDDRRVRNAELFGEHRTKLGVPLIVGLQAGEDQVELLLRPWAAPAPRRPRTRRQAPANQPRHAAPDRRRAPALHGSPAARGPGRPNTPPLPRCASRAGATPLRARTRRARSSRS